ncbi:hypothetical protein LguiB_013035 [Lonicera macranthoides]
MAIVRIQETASSSTYRYNYQVFLSFRGKDTRKTFTDHLYTALIKAGFRTFIDDDEIERGKRLELELRKAIQMSRISIIVLSKNYASSKWCLDEVVTILDWSKSSSGHEVLPVFYDVDPSDIRNQTGSIRETFARYEKELINTEIDDEKKKEWMEKVKSWKAALTEVANLAGMGLMNQANGHEAKFIQEIVKVIERKLSRPVLYVGRFLVGMDSRVENINSWVKDSLSSEYILVISGMGGIGKTTIAKCVYNLNFQGFEGYSFLALVKEESKRSNGLVNLQMQLLSTILNGKKEEIYNVDEGIIKINEAIRCKRVLIVIDDVDEVKQLDALLGMREFCPGSKIIITTRNKSLLKVHEVHRLYAMETLSFYESLELFCWHAFGKQHPDEGYEEQSERVIHHCGGLPLACEILASSLSGKSINVWENTIEKLEEIPEFRILDVLKISYDSLQDDHDRNLFLHIACFFVGHNKDEAIEILNNCDFYAVCGIQNLVDRCLISMEMSNNLMMHQLLQEMGWQIVDQESPKEPWRRSRLWRPQDSFVVLKEKRGTETIEGLVLDVQGYKEDALNVRKGENSLFDKFCETSLLSNRSISFRRRFSNFLSSESSSDEDFNYDAFSSMGRLKLLKLNYASLSGHIEKFPEGLRWLCLHGFPLKSLPFDLPLENLVSLDMSYSKLKRVWIGNKVLLSLKFLNLSHSQSLVETPNFTGLCKLERLILKGCIRLLEICDTIGKLENLALLNLENCNSLRKFPNIVMLKSLQTLVLDGCSNIHEFPSDMKNMDSLKVLNVNEVAVNPSTSTHRDHVKLWHRYCLPWVSKPILKNPQHILVSFPCSLVRLSLQNCGLSDDDFPLDFSNLSMLAELDLSFNQLRHLPLCVGCFRKLSTLDLTSCEELRSISGLSSFTRLPEYQCRSLESVASGSTLTRPAIYPPRCRKLREVQGMFKLEPIEKVNREILDNLGICGVELIGSLRLTFAFWTIRGSPSFEIDENIRQGLHEFGIFSTFLRREEIPIWYANSINNKGSSPSVSFVVPSHPSLRIQGLNVYSVYTIPYTDRTIIAVSSSPNLLFTKINNKTKNLKWIYTPAAMSFTEKGNEEAQLVWLSHWKFGDHLESGDEVDVSVISSSEDLEVKEFGINLVWGEEEMKATPPPPPPPHHHYHHHHEDNMTGVIGGDLSNYQLMSSTTFFLCHHYTFPLIEWQNSRFRELFGDNLTLEDVERWDYARGGCWLFF